MLGEFQRMAQGALAKSNPVDDLLELAGELRRYEQQYSMSSPGPRPERGTA